MRLFLAGDVMTGRGIDQILRHPGDPALREGYVTSALDYVALAEERYGPIPRAVAPTYVWGDGLAALASARPHARIVNLETSVTTSDDFARKVVCYRMAPANVAVLGAAGIDCCTLANNHVLDFGREGLDETLATLEAAGIAHCGAGADLAAARAPAAVALPGGRRLLIFACGFGTSGIPPGWAAAPGRPGVHRLRDFSRRTLDGLTATIASRRRRGDLVLVSIHWGGNWGYPISADERAFARGLIEAGGADLVMGHSSHHPRPFEVHRGKLILYGCGDFLNDYEGIGGRERYRAELVLMILADLTPESGRLAGLTLRPFRIRHFRLNRASREEAAWLRDVLNREGAAFGSRVLLTGDDALVLAAG